MAAIVLARNPVHAGRGMLVQGCVVFSIGILLAFVMGISRDGWWQVPLFICSAMAAFLAWRGYPWPDDWSRYLSFGAGVLIACALNRLLYIADFFIAGERFSEWPFFSTAPEVALMKAEIATILGTFITVAAWMSAGGARYSPSAIFAARRKRVISTLGLLYVTSLFGLIVLRIDPELVGALGQLVPTLLSVGTASAFFLPMALSTRTGIRLFAVAFMSVPFFYAALGTGMKENIILAALPTGYMLWTTVRGLPQRVMMISITVVFVGLITSYVGYYRAEVWYGGRVAGQQRMLAEYLEQPFASGPAVVLKEGLVKFVSRGNTSAYRGWAISLADEYGHEPELVFAPMAYVFVPRVLWPEKPEIRQGWEYSALVFGADYASRSNSSTASGLFPSFYLGGGWLAVVFGAAGIGVMMAWLLRLSRRVGGGLLVALFSFSTLPFALRLDEAWAVSAMAEPIIGFVYLSAIFMIARGAFGVLSRSVRA